MHPGLGWLAPYAEPLVDKEAVIKDGTYKSTSPICVEIASLRNYLS